MNDTTPTDQEWTALARENKVQADGLTAVRKALTVACVNMARPVDLDTSWPDAAPATQEQKTAARRMAARERAWLRTWG